VEKLGAAWGGVQAWLLEGSNAPLLLVLLLLLWLLTAVRRREDPRARRPRRPEPVNLDELGRLAFQAARSRDAHMWRDLFINGAEARGLLGDRAQAFVEARTPDVLRSVLDAVADQIPVDAIFDGIETDDAGQHALRVRSETKGPRIVGIGRSVQLGVTWRLLGGDIG
jgi:hypothetical protein